MYGVYFWSTERTVCDEFELTGAADVHEVLHWIDQHANGRAVEAMVVVDRCDVGRRVVLGSCAAYRIGPLDHGGSAQAGYVTGRG